MSSQPNLTIGMAVHNDWQGVYFTIQSLRLHHAGAMRRCELLVVDNDPDSQEGQWTRDLVSSWVGAGVGKNIGKVTYIAAPSVEGTSAPRQKVFEEASSPYVLCLDCHVLLNPGALSSLMGYYERNPDSTDLISGPLWMDNLTTYATHFDSVWRDQMWGVWACAWQCQCGWVVCPRMIEPPPSSRVAQHYPRLEYRDIMGGGPVKSCPECDEELPQCDWCGHELVLESKSFKPVGALADDLPFEIPAMGLGLFSMRKEAWPGFNPRFRGFGGEEFYIHEKVRRAGGKCICLPSLGWIHRFTRQGQRISYILNVWDKTRNFVIGHQELGLDLAPVYNEFVVKGLMPLHEWEECVAGADWPSGAPRPPRRESMTVQQIANPRPMIQVQ